jgi:hypothetical protein
VRDKLNVRVQRLAGLRVTKQPAHVAGSPQPISTRRPTFTQMRSKLERQDRRNAASVTTNHDRVTELINQAEKEVGIDQGSQSSGTAS